MQNTKYTLAKPTYQWCNLLALAGYIFSAVWRLWGFSALVCALGLYFLGARARQYAGVVVADSIYAGLLYWWFGRIQVAQLMEITLIFEVICFIYWYLTLAKPARHEQI